MTDSGNPFAAPIVQQAAIAPQKPTGAYIGVELDQLVLQHGAVLPNVCVKTNQPATRVLKRTFYWHHPAILLAILTGLLLYIILVLVLRKRMVVNIPLSEEAFQKRRKGMMICGILMGLCGLSIVGSIVGLATMPRLPAEGVAAMYISLLVISFIGLLIAAIFNGRIAGVLRPKKITNIHGWFLGCNKEYLRGIQSAYRQPTTQQPQQ